VVLALGAAGDVVFVGRGAGWLLPRETTLHARIVAPLADRIAYMGQWLRLTPDEAAERVRVRDSRRAEFLAGHLQAQPSDIHQYDLVLNSSHLGEELCAELIVHAIKARSAARLEPGGGP
jgi:cytidylate kinase